MTPFLTNKEKLENPEIMPQDKGNIVSDESVLVKNFQQTLHKYSGKVVW